ncbi:triose-phosphate isomerase [Alphaproteobacteria bacterium]|nr:triose-phosphate isomerase [Alphaproteobacteria bacterium]
MRIPMIAGNWKMNILNDNNDFPEQNYVMQISEAIKNKNVEVAIFPPFTHLGLMFALIDELPVDESFNVGVQNISDNENGAFTGDVSAELVSDIGGNIVILGHSERRSIHNETNDEIYKKAEITMKHGFQAVICIGETDQQNQSGDTLKVISEQFEKSTPSDINVNNLVIAYEPVWAIGTGRTPSLDDIEKIHSSLRNYISQSRGAEFANSVRILYGGSVNAKNASEILDLSNVDGALVGGASLMAEDFVKIIKSL